MKSLSLMLAPLLILAACSEVDMPDPEEGAALFESNCKVCHGPGGRGDGDFAAGMRPKPADLTLLARNNGGQLSRTAVLSAIDGYSRSSKAQQQMPEFGLLLEGDTVPLDVGDGRMTPVPRPLAALVLYLEKLQR